jgi:transcriptional regulator with PAS, ATPase and Fis domain
VKGEGRDYSRFFEGFWVFTINRKIKRIDVKPSDLLTIISSVNYPYVAVGGPAREAEAYIVSTKDKNKRSVYICFHIIADEERLFFTPDEGQVSDSERKNLEVEAVKFLEDMGFVMVNKNASKKSEEEKEKIITSTSPFVRDLSEIKEAMESEKQAKKSKKAEDEEEEYEEVVEEVYEEVLVDDEEGEYENLEDLADQVDGDKASQKGGSEASFDLKKEISDVVESIDDDTEAPKKDPDVPAQTEKAQPEDVEETMAVKFFVEGELRYLARLLIFL